MKIKIPNISSLVKKTNFNTKVSNLDGKIDKINSDAKNAIEKFFLIFLGSTLFDSEGGSQAYLIFQPVYRYFKMVTSTNYISLWKSKGLSAESIKPPTTTNDSLTPELSYYDYNIRVTFTGSCLKQSNIMYTHEKVVIFTLFMN